MQKSPFHPVSSLLRKVLILGVLAGLVFSCAEGVRLLPFPPPGATNGTDSFRADSGGPAHLSYIKSFENGRGSNSSRSKRSLDTHFLGGPVTASIPFIPAVAVAPDVSPAFTPVSYSDGLDARLPGTRGPPVFFPI